MCVYLHVCLFVCTHDHILVCACMCVRRTIFERLGAVPVNKQEGEAA